MYNVILITCLHTYNYSFNFIIIFMTDPPLVYNTTISSSATPADDLSGFDIIISWTVSMVIEFIVKGK